jgi:hypothetical protein
VNLPASRSASRILHASSTLPAGAARRRRHALFERRQRDGADVHFVNLVKASDAALLRDTIGPEFDNPRRWPMSTRASWTAVGGAARRADRAGRAPAPDAILAHGFSPPA